MLGLELAWLILIFDITVIGIYITIILLQIIVEFLVVRNYAIAAVFIIIKKYYLPCYFNDMNGLGNNIILKVYDSTILFTFSGAIKKRTAVEIE